MRTKGTVIRYNATAGYGWVLPAGTRRSIFIHNSDVKDNLVLAPGDILEFDIVPAPKGNKAVNAVLLSEAVSAIPQLGVRHDDTK